MARYVPQWYAASSPFMYSILPFFDALNDSNVLQNPDDSAVSVRKRADVFASIFDSTCSSSPIMKAMTQQGDTVETHKNYRYRTVLV